MKALPSSRNLAILIGVMALLPLSMKAQGILIDYDYIGNKEMVYKITPKGDTVLVNNNHLRAKKGTPVTFRVSNYNSFALNMKASMISSREDTVSNFNLAGMGTMLMGLMSPGLMFGGAPPPVDPNLPPAARGNIFEAKKILVNDLNRLQREVATFESVNSNLKNLQSSTELSEADIKARAADELRKIIPVADMGAQNGMEVDDLQAVYDSLSKKVLSFNYALAYYKELNGVPANADPSAGNGEVASRGRVDYSYRGFDRFNSSFTEGHVDTLANGIYQSYNGIMKTSYRKTVYFNSTGNNQINVEFYKRSPVSLGLSNNPMDDEVELVKTRLYKIRHASNVGICSSIGISFTGFYKREQDFFANGDTVGSSNGSMLTPAISTLITCYGKLGEMVSLGGSFGISLPVTDNRSFCFILGPSIIIGRNQQFCINGGMSIGRQNTLDKGYKVGDVLRDSDRDVPVKKVFQPGFFFGLSFNFSNVFGGRQ